MFCSTVYITDASNGIINVYSVECNYVNSFGQYGSKAGGLESHIMSVDHDAFFFMFNDFDTI